MNIDDIYNAAVRGDKELLTSLLQTKEVDINAPIDCGVSNGFHTTVPLLFSILSTMKGSEKGFLYDVLDILVAHGINLNSTVELKSDAVTHLSPMMVYAISEWKSPELVQYLLRKGMNPNIEKVEKYADGHYERYSLLYFSIVKWTGCKLMQTVLQYGADPNHLIQTYSHHYACCQLLPPLFYALTQQKDLEKTALLISYGANINGKIDVNCAAYREFRFQSYINMHYMAYSDMLQRAYTLGMRNPMQATPVVAVRPGQAKAAAAPQSAPQKPASKPMTDEEKLRNLAKFLIRFERDNWSLYLNVSITSQEKPGLFGRSKVKKAQETLQALRNERSQRIAALNQLDQRVSGGKIPRWWNKMVGFDYVPCLPEPILLWMPFSRVATCHHGLRLCPSCTAEDTITGQELKLLIKAGEMEPMYMDPLDDDGKYSIAELCLWSIQDATQVSVSQHQRYSNAEIRNRTRQFEEGMDRFERFSNTVLHNDSMTDSERYLCSRMKDSDYFDSQFTRQTLSLEYDSHLRNQTETRVVVSDQQMYEQNYQPVGVIALRDDGTVAALLAYTQVRKVEVYKVNSEKIVFGIEQNRSRRDYTENRLLMSVNLEGIPFRNVDILAEKPEYLSNDEWNQFVFSCYEWKKQTLEKRIKAAYETAAAQKRRTIQSNQ